MSARDGAVSVTDARGRHLDDGSVARGLIARARALGFVQEPTIGDYDTFLYEDAREAWHGLFVAMPEWWADARGY